MPTQEERLTKLEFDLRQFKTETIKAYGDMAFEVTIVKGLIENAIGRLASLRTSTEQQFAQVRQDIAEVKQDITDVKAMLTQVLARLPEKP
jgi:phage shock protein A